MKFNWICQQLPQKYTKSTKFHKKYTKNHKIAKSTKFNKATTFNYWWQKISTKSIWQSLTAGVITGKNGGTRRVKKKQRLRAQEEIQQNSTNLIRNAVGKLARNSEPAKKFKTEIDHSVAIPELLRDHLGFVGDLSSNVQLLGLIGENVIRTLI